MGCLVRVPAERWFDVAVFFSSCEVLAVLAAFALAFASLSTARRFPLWATALIVVGLAALYAGSFAVADGLRDQVFRLGQQRIGCVA